MTATTLIPIGMGLIVLGAAYGIGKFAAAALKVSHASQKRRTRLQEL